MNPLYSTPSNSTLPVRTEYPSSVPWGFLTELDLISPSDLRGKTLGVDYCLIAHYADVTNLASISQKGLMTLAQLAAEPDASQSVRESFRHSLDHTHFGRDPSLIYTLPICPNGVFKVHPTSIVFATHPGTVTIFNQEGRAFAYGVTSLQIERNNYLSFSMSYQSFEQRSAQATYGLLDKFRFPRALQPHDHGYWAEILLKPVGSAIDLLAFSVPHDMIPDELKGEASTNEAETGSSPTLEPEMFEDTARAAWTQDFAQFHYE